ncbi:CBS domain protein [archaeon BMS3Bbin15]|nr:CBS domain protein [archaeon BMS3Bbin15]
MSFENIPDKKVSELMTGYVLMIEPELTVLETIEKMTERNFRCIIVARMTPYKELGLVTRFDIMEKVIGRGKNPFRVRIIEIMDKPVYYIAHDATIREAAMIMGENQVCNLPVKKDGDVIGVISSSDIFNEYLSKTA